MAEKIKYAIMQQTRATASEWTATNPVLFEGQIGYDTTNKKFKIGDGSTPWNSLPYFAEKGETGATGATGNGINYTADTTETTTTSLYVSQLVNPTAQIGDLILSANSQLFKVTNIADSLLIVSYLTTLTATAAEAVITSLNGSTTTGRSIYAPTTYGAIGYELIGNRQNEAPIWRKPLGYLTCSTAASVAAKEVDCNNFRLTQGVKITVHFTYGYTGTTAATLSVGGAGAFPIVWKTSTTAITSTNSWQDGAILTLVYDVVGSTGYWRIIYSDPYPINSIYQSSSSTSPAKLFGGTWTRLTTASTMTSDHVVATGTSGVWRYRRWASGFYECWYARTLQVNIAEAWGSVYVAFNAFSQISYPVTFTSAPQEVATLKAATYSAFLAPDGGRPNTTTQTAGYNVVRPTTTYGESTDFTLHYYVSGMTSTTYQRYYVWRRMA